TGGTNYLQSVDLRYNIRGWLRSINNAQLANDANVTNDDTGDYFGMELLYDNVDAGLSNTAAYNGNISAAKWKTMGEAAGTAGQRSYKYLYDKSDKLKSATFQAYGTTAWNKEVNTLNESQTYDHNGNILGLQRNQNLRGLSGPTITSTPQAIDNLTYTYTTGNQLSKVEDAVPIAIGMGDFKNNSNVAAEYTYNGLGSATKDLNKNITSITYNVLGKVQKVTYGGTPVNSVTYTYDARGAKLRTVTVVGSTTTTTDYIDGFVYTNNVLSFFGSPEGRVVKNGSALEYQYAIADHQGNTRVVFSSVAPTPLNIMATFEGDANDNAGQFTSVNAANVVTFVAANHTPAGGKVVRMNQSYPVGPAKNVKVYAGDKVDMEVWAYYEPTSGYGTGAPTVAAMVTAVATAFGGVSGGAGESGSIFNGVNSALTGFGLGGNAGDAAPAAYLNYILYDQQYKVVDMGWTRMPASANFSKQRMSIPQITVKEAGYVFVYLSYEDLSNNFVQFDDFKIVHTKSNLIQGSEYYAYGMQTASSWTRENATGNQFLYNGGTELNALTSLYDLEYRNFDPVLGRMHQVDPLADKYGSINPYNFALGNPAYFNDPSGADVPLYMLERRATKNADDTFTAGNQAAGGAGPGSGPAGWNSATYGSSAGAGGGTNDFVRLGPGDGGALQAIAAPFFQRAEDRKATGQLIAQAWNSSAENSTTIHVVQGGQIVASASALSIVRDMGNQALMSYYSNVIASTGIRGGNLLASLSYSIRTCPNCGVYPDGRTGVEPLIGGIIYEPTLTTSWFRFNEGFKLYYDKGYNNLIWNPLSPRTDNLSVVSKMTSPDRFAGFKNGYENGYNNGYDTQLR
ncbi:MAG: hypothetical protein K2U26_17755, partial [Cyclobacteriaceae bacterium]|nr:hypothetical protein [Cyclobacteriaceae bacterium]